MALASISEADAGTRLEARRPAKAVPMGCGPVAYASPMNPRISIFAVLLGFLFCQKKVNEKPRYVGHS